MPKIEAEIHPLSDGGLPTVRTATPDDAPATPALFRVVVEEEAFTAREPSELGLMEAEEREYIEEDREAPANWCLVTTESGGMVAMGLLVEERAPGPPA